MIRDLGDKRILRQKYNDVDIDIVVMMKEYYKNNYWRKIKVEIDVYI